MLSSIVPSCLHEGNPKRHQRRVNSTSRRRIKRAFTPIPKRYLATIPRRLRSAFMEIWEYGNCHPCAMPYRLLAARLDVHIRTAQEYCYRLRDAGHLGIQVRPIGRCRNDSNVFSFPKLVNFITQKEHGEITVEKQVQNLNTNTNTPRMARVENHPPIVRKLYALVGELQRRLRLREKRDTYRLQSAQERTRRAMTGAYTGPKTPDPSEAEIRAFWERDAKHKAEYEKKLGRR